jgi:hypothetical protein
MNAMRFFWCFNNYLMTYQLLHKHNGCMKFLFYCDESYDGREPPNALAISGFFSDQPTWNEVEKDWNSINCRFGVSRFHAQPLNGTRGEYSGWDEEKKVCYSAALLEAINCQKKRMVAYNCGMRADEYRGIINEVGREKLGHPWYACFKSCIAMIARHMEDESDFPADWHFDVVLDGGSKFDKQAPEFFKWLANNPTFSYRHRLGTCTSAKAEEHVGLQVADLMAYEYFKRLRKGTETKKVRLRTPLELIQYHNHYEEGFFGQDTLKKMKDQIESARCEPNQLVIIPKL